MRVFIPYTVLQPYTKLALRGYHPTLVKLDDAWGYTDYWQARWDEREDVISVEHDIVPWHGALEAMDECPEAWCFHQYSAGETVPPGTPYFGCVKITSRLMDKMPDVWERQRSATWGEAAAWTWCDAWLYQCATELGIEPHQHTPPVSNLNPCWFDE